MLKNEFIWDSTPIIYNSKKYAYKILENDYIRLYEINTNKTIFELYAPIFIKEIRPDEFIIVYPSSIKIGYEFILQHQKQDKIIYQKKYIAKSKFGEITQIDDIYLLEGFFETILYNTITNKEVILENTKVTEVMEKELTEKYLQGKMDIVTTFKEQDNLFMYINTDTLEFNGFYSELQDRFIPIIINKDKTFKENLTITINEEVIKYIKLLENHESTLR